MQASYRSAYLFVSANYANKISRDLITPSLPAIAIAFNTSPEFVKLSISLYFLGIALSQFIWPVIADSLGARKVLVWNIGLFLIGTLLAIMMPSLDMILVARFLQGLGIGCLPAISRASMFHELRQTKTLKLLGYLSGITAWSQAIAISAGALLQSVYGWRANFMLMLVMGLWLMMLYLKILPNDKRETQLSAYHFFNGYKTVLVDTEVLRYLFSFCFMFSINVIFFASSPFIILDTYHLSIEFYGYLSFLIVGGLLLGKIVVGYLSERLSIAQIVLTGLIVSSLALSALYLIALFTVVSYWQIYFLVMISFVGSGMTNPSNKTAVMSSNPAYASTASALIGMMSALFSSIIVLLVSVIKIDTVLSLSAVLLGLVMLAWCSYLMPGKKSLRDPV